jgi:predicted pyridoxine 5'-phosphate oxidase superfamily flavin-nucleotide-binding protein
LGTFKRAAAFYDKQMLDHLNPLMREYIARQEMMFIGTADAHGECDTSFRAGPPGFVRVLDDRTVMYPEYRGNGVMASLGNIAENGHVGILFVDFFYSTVGLHVNGTARIVENGAVTAFASILERAAGVTALHDQVEDKKKTPERWVVVEIVEAYIHCSKHIPFLRKLDKDIDWGTDSEARKGGDYFKAKHDPRPWVAPKQPAAAPAAEKPDEQTLACDSPAEPEVAPAAEAVAEAVAAPAPEAVAASAPEPEPVAAPAPEPEPVAVSEPDLEPVAEPVPTAQDDFIEFPVAAVTVPPAPEKYAFGPEITLEEQRADEDSRAAAAEHDAAETTEDILDLWVVPEWRPAVF